MGKKSRRKQREARAAAGAGGGAAPTNEEAEAEKAKGNDAFRVKQYATAIACYTKAIALDRKNHIFFSNRSAAYLGEGEIAAALKDAEKCVKLAPRWAKGFLRKGNALEAQHLFAKALVAYQAGLKIEPANKALKAAYNKAYRNHATTGGSYPGVFERMMNDKTAPGAAFGGDEKMRGAREEFLMNKEVDAAVAAAQRAGPHGCAAAFRALLAANGTDLAAGDTDPFGDGDQSRLLTSREQHVHRSAWSAGGDFDLRIQTTTLSELGMACATGQTRHVRHLLSLASTDKQRTELLERRECVQRLSPLLITIAGMKRISGPGVDHVGCADLLIEAGARVDARDFMGKTVVHYGAGMMASDESMRVVEKCIARGDASGLSPRLVDVQDRVGGVAAHEVVMSQRADVAKFLGEHNARMDIKEWGKGRDGLSPMDMLRRSGLMNPDIFAAFNEVDQRQKFAEMNTAKRARACDNCGKRRGEEGLQWPSLKQCARCKKACYCSAACQRAHWEEHKAFCGQASIKIDRPEAWKDNPQTAMCKVGTYVTNLSGADLAGGRKSVTVCIEPTYKPPPRANVGDRFYVKIQRALTGTGPMKGYDKSRKLVFFILPGAPAFKELDQIIRSKGMMGGLKGFFEAKVDAAGDLHIFPHRIRAYNW